MDEFRAMKSTKFSASLFRSRAAVHSILSEASKVGHLGVRAMLLSITGSLTTSYCKSRDCICGNKFSFQHLMSCSFLGPGRLSSLELSVDTEDWRGVVITILSRFEVFIHAVWNGDLRSEKLDFFKALNVYATKKSDAVLPDPQLKDFFR